MLSLCEIQNISGHLSLKRKKKLFCISSYCVVTLLLGSTAFNIICAVTSEKVINLIFFILFVPYSILLLTCLLFGGLLLIVFVLPTKVNDFDLFIYMWRCVSMMFTLASIPVIVGCILLFVLSPVIILIEWSIRRFYTAYYDYKLWANPFSLCMSTIYIQE